MPATESYALLYSPARLPAIKTGSHCSVRPLNPVFYNFKTAFSCVLNDRAGNSVCGGDVAAWLVTSRRGGDTRDL